MKKDTEKFNLDENKFTNESELEYPTEEDFIDIKVLNNNTRLLNEKKVDIESIENVARESTPMAIENAVKNNWYPKLLNLIFLLFKIKYSIIPHTNIPEYKSFICSHILSLTGKNIENTTFGKISYKKWNKTVSKNITTTPIIFIFFKLI